MLNDKNIVNINKLRQDRKEVKMGEWGRMRKSFLLHLF